jgi:hypothetical protein
MSEQIQSNKPHNPKKTKLKKSRSKSAEKASKKIKSESDDESNEKTKFFDTEVDDIQKAKARNPRAFALQSYVAAEKRFRRYFKNKKTLKLKDFQMSFFICSVSVAILNKISYL